MLNVGVIGTGFIGKAHVETLLRIPGVRVNALVESNVELAQTLADEYGVEIATGDYTELLDHPDIDVFHNCTPNNVHFEINERILEAGKHLLSEKPLATTKEEARILRDLAIEKERVTAVNFCYRYYPAIQEAAARVRAGEIGKVHSVFGAFLQDWLLYETDYNWRLDKGISGASNTVADIGSHWCDLAQFVAGAKIVEVMADLRTILPVRKKPKTTEVLTFAEQVDEDLEEVPIEVDDYGSVLLHFENGIAGAFSVCQLCAGRKCSLELQVYGSQAGLAWTHENPAQLWIGQRRKANEVLIENPLLQHESSARFARLPSGHPMGYYDALYNLFFDFYQAVALGRGGETPSNRPTFQDGYDEMAILDAILESHTGRKWVAVSR